MTGKLPEHRTSFAKFIQQYERDLLTDGSEFGADQVRDLIDTPGGGQHSDPHEPPLMQTGELLEGVYAETYLDGHVAVVGSERRESADTPLVPKYLEEGTSIMTERPYMKPAADETWRLRAKFIRSALQKTRRKVQR